MGSADAVWSWKYLRSEKSQQPQLSQYFIEHLLCVGHSLSTFIVTFIPCSPKKQVLLLPLVYR